MNAEFSRLAASVLHSPYFSYTRYAGPDEPKARVKWCDLLYKEKRALEDELHSEKVNRRLDLTDVARAIWDRAYEMMMESGQVKQAKGETDDEFDVRERMTGDGVGITWHPRKGK